MICRGGHDKYAIAIAWGKVQGLLRAQMLEPGAYDVVVAESKRLIAGKQTRGYRPGYADMLAECGHSQV